MCGATRDMLLIGSCTFDPRSLTLRDAAGSTLRLRSQSVRVLAELVRTRGAIVPRDALIETVWHGVAVTDDSLVQCIKDIRTALSDRDHTLLRTVVGQGYAISARIVSDDADAPPRVCIERFKVAGDAPESGELADSLFENLVMRLAPRAGIRIVTAPCQRMDSGYVISGRVSARGGRTRIFAQIMRSGRVGDIRAAMEEASGDDIWNLPGRVADKIASELRVVMLAGEGSRLLARDDADLSAQELMTKAAWHLCRFRRENWHAARASLEAAVRIAPQNPVALAMLASWDTQMIPLIPFNELPGDPGPAMDLARRAVELGQSIDYVLRTRGNLRLWRRGDHEGARHDCRRALEINPVFHLAHLTIGTSEILSGEFSSGYRRLEEMMRRAPTDPQNPLYLSLMAIAALLEGNRSKALVAAREGHERNPLGSWNALVYAAAAAKEDAISEDEEWARVIRSIELPARHFCDLPFVDTGHAEYLVARAVAAGVGRSKPNAMVVR
jgi:DNA-binding winged helix-turn-helix (wHTH) protein/tetratricopeptide (TPR) repeat protein